uniref:Uncharacterized protein n=1 Tax=Plectus sambesii TaxID=2011161 RepID=A0A914UME5_9BILA
DGSAFFGAQSWSFLIQAVSPLIVFYRFHSSVCLAEIWKHCYTFKESHGGGHGSSQVNGHGGLSRSASVRTMVN